MQVSVVQIRPWAPNYAFVRWSTILYDRVRYDRREGRWRTSLAFGSTDAALLLLLLPELVHVRGEQRLFSVSN
jgi:hypothetical protein